MASKQLSSECWTHQQYQVLCNITFYKQNDVRFSHCFLAFFGALFLVPDLKPTFLALAQIKVCFIILILLAATRTETYGYVRKLLLAIEDTPQAVMFAALPAIFLQVVLCRVVPGDNTTSHPFAMALALSKVNPFVIYSTMSKCKVGKHKFITCCAHCPLHVQYQQTKLAQILYTGKAR